MLTSGQHRAKQQILQELRSSKGAILSSPAGYGKSYLLKNIIATTHYKKILVLAETNQAVNLLRGTLGVAPGVDFKTVCGGLNYVLEPTIHGFKLIQKAAPDWREYDLVILDECSQVGKDRFAELLNISRKIIISGDDKQAPPVGEVESPAFTTTNFKRIELTVPMRNSTDIFGFLQELRATIGTRKIFPKGFQVSAPLFEKLIKEEMDSFGKGDAVVLALSEKGKVLKSVSDYNDKITKILFGSSTFLHPGERIVFKKSYLAFNKSSGTADGNRASEFPIFTNMRGAILTLGSEELKIGRFILSAFKVEVSLDDYPGRSFFCYTPMDIVASEHVRVALFARGDKKALKYFFSLWSSFQPAYATNVYVCQGLSIKKVFVDLKDIQACTKDSLLLRQKLFYVAASRAVEELYIKV